MIYGKNTRYEFYEHTTFESIYIDVCMMMMVYNLPKVLHVSILSFSVNQRLSIVPSKYPNTTFL